MLFLFICLNFSNKSKIKCATNAAAISGGMSHTMFPVIFVSILLYNLQKMFFSTFQQISMSNSHRTSCEFLKDIFGRISGADSGARWSPSRIAQPHWSRGMLPHDGIDQKTGQNFDWSFFKQNDTKLEAKLHFF